MITLLDLNTALLDILFEIRESNLTLIIGGGYGIYLKRQHVRTTNARTLLQQWPEARSTNDLDLFLRPELLIEPAALRPLQNALQTLGYQVIETAAKYQFAIPRTAGEGGQKVDLLTGPQSCFVGTSAKVDTRRVRPTPSIDLHAHPLNEAVTLEDGLLAITVEGSTSKGQSHQAFVYVPHPFTYVMMKLFAFRDRFNDVTRDHGSYHALDIYAVMATTTEPEWEQAHSLFDAKKEMPEVLEASRLVEEFFSTPTSKGILRMKESPYYRPEFQLDEFRSSLSELFQVPQHKARA